MDIFEKTVDAFGIPPEVATGIVKTEIIGTQKLYAENCTALLEYTRENIKLKFRTGITDIEGDGLEIKTVSDGNIVIFGKIKAVRFI